MATSAFVTLLLAGVGHYGGSGLPFALLFPFAFLLAVVTPNTPPLIWAVGLAQFPAYGFIVAWRWVSHPLSRTALTVGVSHCAAAGLSAVIYFNQ